MDEKLCKLYAKDGFKQLWYDEWNHYWVIAVKRFSVNEFGFYDIVFPDETLIEKIPIYLDSKNNITLNMYGIKLTLNENFQDFLFIKKV